MTAPMLDPTKYDERGLPWRGSVRKDSPYYFPKTGVTVLFNGQRCRHFGIIEFDRLEGWMLVKHVRGQDRAEFRVYGKVDLLWTPKPGEIVTDLTGIRINH